MGSLAAVSLLLLGALKALAQGGGEVGPPCRLSEFYCDTGQCIALDKFCDGEDNCGDKSDEPRYCSRK